jgi:hypothetical protein
MTILEALQAASARGWNHFVFESDSKIVTCPDLILLFLVLNCNPNFDVKSIKQQANMTAHILARAGISWPYRTLFNCIPRCITIVNEMS